MKITFIFSAIIIKKEDTFFYVFFVVPLSVDHNKDLVIFLSLAKLKTGSYNKQHGLYKIQPVLFVIRLQ